MHEITYKEWITILRREVPRDPRISITEAIDIMTKHLDNPLEPKYADYGTKWRSAVKLGIRALKYYAQKGTKR
jgi:hypothetical protein